MFPSTSSQSSPSRRHGCAKSSTRTRAPCCKQRAHGRRADEAAASGDKHVLILNELTMSLT